MNPAFSVVIFTTLAGAAQGLIVTLALAVLAGVTMAPGFVGVALIVAEAMLVAGLAASFAHLGRPGRAWRAVLMWRTSWLSREVIVLPALIGVVGAWYLLQRGDAGAPWAAVIAIVAVAVAGLLWYCTAMIYACLRFIEEWAQPLTVVNFVLIGLSSGLVMASALAALRGEAALLRACGPAALAITLVAWCARLLSLRRNEALAPRSTLQTATGIRSARLVQTSMGMSAGSFNTREFIHGVAGRALVRIRLGFLLFAFALPAALMACGWLGSATAAWWLAALVQAPGLLAERWFLFRAGAASAEPVLPGPVNLALPPGEVATEQGTNRVGL